MGKILVALADPAANFMQSIKVVEDAVGGFSFAIGWVVSPSPVPNANLKPLPAMPVSGYGLGRQDALDRLMFEAVERNSSVYTGGEELAAPDLVLGCSLAKGRERLVPAAAVYLGYASKTGSNNFVTNSNGCAASETMTDAIRRGLFEVVERDAVAAWWFNRIQRPALSFENEPTLCAIEQKLAHEHCSLALFDLTHNLGLHVVAAVTCNAAGGQIYVGAAADISEPEAARRAAFEMFQFWLWGRISGDPPYRAAWLRNENLKSQPWLSPATVRPLHEANAKSLDLPAILNPICAAGFEPVYVDLTRPWLDIPVARVIVPGLLPLAPAFVPGRLFDLPVQLGWRGEATPKKKLMRYPCPI